MLWHLLAVPLAKNAKHSIQVAGVLYESKRQAARALGIPHYLFTSRILKGLTPEQAAEVEPFPEWFNPGKGQAKRAKGDARARQELAEGLRRCGTCKNKLPFESFSRAGERGLSYRCKNCDAIMLIKHRYGIGAKEFEMLRLSQDGKCGICDCDLDLTRKSVRRRQTVAVDHCHQTGVVRGLLCNCCNAGLGSFGDDPERLQKAIEYLRQSKNGSPALALHCRTAAT